MTAPLRLRFEDCEIDLATYEVRRGGQACPVEPQVFELLAYLARNADRLVTKDELIEKIWGGRIVSDAALSSRIRSARKVIGDDGSQQRLIRTVHGRGLRFVGKIERADAEPPTPSHRTEPETPATSPRGNLPPQEIRFCSAKDGVRLAYATVGRGPPLVKPSNWLTHLEYDWESPVWRHWIGEFAHDHMLVRYDQRANGLSDWEVEDLSFDALVDDLEAVVDAIGLANFPMLCISQGCAIAAAYAVRHPERVSRLVFYGSYARGWAMRDDPAQMARRRALGTLIEHGWGQDNPAFRQVFTTLLMPGGTVEHMSWFNELQRRSASPRNAQRLNDSFGQVDVRHLLPEVQVPTLVLHCRGDQAVPFEEGRIMAAGLRNARFVPLDSDNHILQDSEPAWTRFVSEVRGFLAMED